MQSIETVLGLDPSLYMQGSMPMNIDPYEQLESLGINPDAPAVDPNELLEEYTKELTKNKSKIIDEINPVVLENEQARYQKELENYEKRKNDIKVKYKKPPVAEVRGEIYRGDADNTNRNIGLAALGIGAGLGTLALLNRKAIGQGLNIAGEYARHKSHLRHNAEGEPTKMHYLRDMSVFNIPAYNKWRKEKLAEEVAKGVTGSSNYVGNIFTKPMRTVGETAGRIAYDAASHGTQSYLWRAHPLDIAGEIGKRGVDVQGRLGGPGQALLLLAATQPAIALTGAYDITNPSELFRPEGFKQNNPNTDDPRQSTAPAEELFQRFMMGRTGRPLKYSAAKEEIPDLTPGRYKDFMRYMFQDKGVLNLGLAKATGENLQGVPEARILGYPVTIDAASTFAGGVLGSSLGMSLVDLHKINQPKPNEYASVDITNEQIRARNEKPNRPEPGKRKSSPINSNIDDVSPGNQGKQVKTGSMKYLLGGLGGVAAGAVAGHFLGSFIQNQIKKENDEKRAAEEFAEHGYKPKGYYVTDGNNNPIVL